MTSLEQAWELQKRITNCKNALNYYDNFRNKITKGEVLFRFNSLYGLLMMAHNDINELVKSWSTHEIDSDRFGLNM